MYTRAESSHYVIVFIKTDGSEEIKEQGFGDGASRLAMYQRMYPGARSRLKIRDPDVELH